VVVQGGEELLGLDVVSDLGKLCNLSVLCSAVWGRSRGRSPSQPKREGGEAYWGQGV
jgi:hypothetical protein